MRLKNTTLVVLGALCLCTLGHNAWGSTLPGKQAKQIYGHRALTFEQNLGQTDAEARFLARGSGYTVFATRNEIVVKLRAASSVDNVVRLSWEGADAEPEPQ